MRRTAVLSLSQGNAAHHISLAFRFAMRDELIVMSRTAPQRCAAPARPINPRPGVVCTLILIYPYVSNSWKSFPRSTGHDIVVGILLTLLWGTIFYWDTIGTKWPLLRLGIEVDHCTAHPRVADDPLRHDLLPAADQVAVRRVSLFRIHRRAWRIFLDAIFLDLSFMTALNVRASRP